MAKRGGRTHVDGEDEEEDEDEDEEEEDEEEEEEVMEDENDQGWEDTIGLLEEMHIRGVNRDT